LLLWVFFYNTVEVDIAEYYQKSEQERKIITTVRIGFVLII
jgi:hypothetical protein